jgi:serine/threonine protein kinase
MPAADQNLLLGIIALQTDFIAKDTLIEALQALVIRSDIDMVAWLVQHNHLNERQAELLENLAQEHVRRNGGTLEEGLAALSAFSTVAPLCEAIDDSTLQQTIRTVTHYREQDDELATNLETTGPVKGGFSPQRRSLDTGSRNRFKILRTHAHGGLGQVSLAEDEELHRNVALKEILAKYADEPTNRERFMVEAEITGRLQHPGIVPVYGLGTYPDGRPFYAMRFIEGDNLLTAIRAFHHRAGDRPWHAELLVAFRDLLGRFMDVCDAMQFAHEKHVLHRDLKPHNIMLGEYGETLVVDWGLAKPLYEGRRPEGIPEEAIVPVSGSAIGGEREGSILGTPDYMPPEQAAGKLQQLSVRSDIYSLGATLFHLLTNSPPFQANVEGKESTGRRQSMHTLLERVRAGEFVEPRKVCPQVPRPLSAICMKAMATRPADRYASARELKQEIQRWLADEPIEAMPESFIDRGSRLIRRNWLISLVSGASLLILSLLISFSILIINSYRVAGIREASINQFSKQLTALVDLAADSQLPLNQGFFEQQFDPLLNELFMLDPERAAIQERKAIEASADDIQRRLSEKTPSETELKQLGTELDAWIARRGLAVDSSSLEPRQAELIELLKNRKAPWSSLPSIDGPALLRSFSAGNGTRLDTENVVRGNADPTSDEFYELDVKQLPANLNHEISASFRADSLDGPMVAIALSPQENRPQSNQYSAVLCIPELELNSTSLARIRRRTGRSLRDAIQNGEGVKLLLCRQNTVLNEAIVQVGLDDFVLRFRREDDWLRAVVEPKIGERTELEYQDFLPLAHGHRPGIWIGNETAIRSITLAYRNRPSKLSDLEQIKTFIVNDDFESALALLDTRTDRESKFLRSRCVSQVSERLDILDELLSQAPTITTDGVVEDKWYLQALLDAIELNESNAERFRDLLLKLTYFYSNSIEDVSLRIPLTLRERMLMEYRKVGGRWRIAVQPTGDTAMLDTAIRLDDVLETNEIVKRSNRWRRCDSWRVLGRGKEASRDLRILLDETLADPAAGPTEAASLFQDLCWVLLSGKRLNEVEVLLQEFEEADDLPASLVVAIEMETARLAVHQSRPDQATDILEKLLANPDRLSPSQYIDASLVAGFVELDRGNVDNAQSIWKQGLQYQGNAIELRNSNAAKLYGAEMAEHQFLITLYGVLASLTNSFTVESATSSFDAQIPDDGVYGAAGREIVGSGFDPEFIRDVANAIYQSDHGRGVARNMAYRIYDIKPYFSEPIKLLVTEGVVVKLFPDMRDDAEFMKDTRDACGELFRMYDDYGINEKEDMPLIVLMWSGQAFLETWETLAPKLPKGVAAGLALVSGKAQLLESEKVESESAKNSHWMRARTMLEIAQDHPAATRSFRRVATRLLKEIE